MMVSAQSSSKRPTFYPNMAALNEEVPAETGLKVPSGGILAASFWFENEHVDHVTRRLWTKNFEI